jgi:alkylation response protein AidB-like acyl-CoA dehydrogenase
MFDQSNDQQLFSETTARYLEDHCSIERVRTLRAHPNGYEPDVWQRGADLGWTSLLVPEDLGGGTISGAGVADLVLVAWQFGRHVAPGPLLPTNLVAAALARSGSPAHRTGILPSLMSGDVIAGWAHAEPPPFDRLGQVELRVEDSGAQVLLYGAKEPVEAAMGADLLLVTAREGPGLSQFLLPLNSPRISIQRLNGLDITRRFARVEFDGVVVPAGAEVGPRGAAGADVAWLSDLAVVVQLAEMVGAMQWAFDTTLTWTFNRYSFGRPLASYQAIKHRFADMKMCLEASYAATAAAAVAVQADSPNRSELVSVAKCYVGRQAPELLQDCVQLHGGIGVTFDHDIHLFLRRVATSIPLHGGPGEHASRITTILESQEAAP